MALQVRELMSWDDAAGLEPRWEALVERNATDTVFLSYAWLRTWWQHFGKGSRLLLLVVESGDELVGAAPLMIDRLPLLEGGAVRVRFTANWQAGAMDLLAVPEERLAVVAALTDHLLTKASRWDVLDLDVIPSGSENLAALEAELHSRGLRVSRMDRWRTPYLPLARSWEEQLTRFSSSMRRKLSTGWRILRAPNVRFVAPAAVPAADLFGKYLAVEQRSWQAEYNPASTMAASPASERFYAELWEAAGERGWVAGGLLEIGGRPAAFSYSLDYHGTVYILKIGYDPEYQRRSPGFVLTALTVQEACQGGRHGLDFVGEDSPWKLRWTDSARTHVRLLAFRRGLHARACHAVLCGLRPRLSRLRPVQRLLELDQRRQRPSRGGGE